MRISVGILTRGEPTERREACAQTWARRLALCPDVEPVFLVGGAERLWHDRAASVLHLPCPDDYRALLFKIHHWLRWALEQGFDGAFKCDDDTFVHADRLVRFDPDGADYVGVDPLHEDQPVFASGGAGYWLSRRAMEAVVRFGDAHPDLFSAAFHEGGERPTEDVHLTACAVRAAGLAFRNDPRFQAWRQPHRFPTRENGGITTHYVTPPLMRLLDHYFYPDAATTQEQRRARWRHACSIDGHMYESELAWLAEQAAGRACVVELGSWRGRSTAALATAGAVFAIDWWLGSPEMQEDFSDARVFAQFQSNLAFEIAAGLVRPLALNLRDPHARAIARRIIGRGVDMVFVDADHSHAAVLEDIALAQALLRPGGLLCGHDYGQYEGVTRAVNGNFPAVANPVGSIWVAGT
ncbi:MAG: class I SAM-dependent methyltransferase [Gemmataceae bacterium]